MGGGAGLGGMVPGGGVMTPDVVPDGRRAGLGGMVPGGGVMTAACARGDP